MLITLVGRSYCHLCDEMRAAVNHAVGALAAPAGGGVRPEIHLEEVDLDDHPGLEDRFGEWVPVLLAGSVATGREICHYTFDADNWAAAIQGGSPSDS